MNLFRKIFTAKTTYPLLILAAGLVVFWWFRGQSIIYYGDFIFPINRALFFKQTFYSWLDASLGLDKLQAVGEILPFGLFVFLSDLLGLSVSWAQKIWVYFMFTASGLSMYFLASYALRDEEENRMAGLLAGLLYMFNPWNATHFAFFWQHMVFIPLALGLYIKGLNENKGKGYAVGFGVILWLTSTTSITNMRALFLEFLILALYFIYHVIAYPGQFKRALKFSAFVLGVFLLTSFYIWFPLIPNLAAIVQETGGAYLDINFSWLDAFKLNSSSSFIESLRLLNSWGLTASHRGYPYYEWYATYKNTLFILFGFIMAGVALVPGFLFSTGVQRKSKKSWLFFGLLFLVGLVITLGKNSRFLLFLADHVKYFSTLFSLPVFHGGTLMIVGFCVLYAFGYQTIVRIIQTQTCRRLLLAGFLTLIAVYGFPVWSGQLVRPENEIMASPRFQIPDYYNAFSADLQARKNDFKLFSISYSKLGYFETTWGFGGIDILENMSGKNVFRWTDFTQRFAEGLNQDVESFVKMGALLNLKYVVHRRDANLKTIKDNPWYLTYEDPVLNELFSRFSSKVQTHGLLDLYRIRNPYFLPHFYVPQNVIVTDQTVKELPQIIASEDYPVRSAIYFKDQNRNLPSSIRSSEPSVTLPVLEFKKISPVKYHLVVHGARTDFPLIFSEKFHPGWKAYMGKGTRALKEFPDLNQRYEAMEFNEAEQASLTELETFVRKGWVSDLGEKTPFDFISKDFSDVIQNDNLKPGSRFETLFKSPLQKNKNHLEANGYANSWWIDLEAVKERGTFRSEKDGSISFELIIEFWPQRLIYLGFFISGLALLMGLGYLGYTYTFKQNH